MQFGVVGGGSWATALAKILTDNGQNINWFVRSERIVNHLNTRSHNPNYLSSVYFEKSRINLSVDVKEVIDASDCIVVAVPSAYVIDTLNKAGNTPFSNKKVISAVKGILPENNMLLNEYLGNKYQLPIENYFTVMGPCHAEEVALEKHS